MKKSIAATALAALALTGCAAAGLEPAPVRTVYVEPAPAIQDDWTESDDFNNLALELAWTDTDATDREVICWGFDNLGEDWVAENWDETSGIPVSLAYEFLEEKCS